MPGYRVTAGKRDSKPYHLPQCFEHYEVALYLRHTATSEWPNGLDKYSTFRLYFPATMECVHCLHFLRVPKRKRRVLQPIRVIKLLEEAGWDELDRWLRGRSEWKP